MPNSEDNETNVPSLATEALRARLEQAEETLRAIHGGEVDALVVRGKDGQQIYTLQSAEHPYRVMVETMNEGAFTVTSEGLILFSNRHFGTILREPLISIVGKSIFSFLPKADHARFAAHYAQIREEPAADDFTLLCRDGTTVPVHLALSPLEIEGLRGACVVVVDLTERAQMEDALRKERDSLKDAKAEAEAANRAKDQFLAVLSHELRTPLTPVLATVTDLMAQKYLPDRIRADMELLRRNVVLEARLIDDLLDVTRISRGSMELHLEMVDVHESLQTALEICTNDIKGKELKVLSDLAARHHHVRADPTRLRQVFWNLLRNAVKFTCTRGRITIRTGNTDHKIRIQVIDTGVGIEPQFLPRVFETFEQSKRLRSGGFGGLGLGLSIAKSVVEMHHGSIAAHSDGSDKGATFTVELATVAALEPAPFGPPSTLRESAPLRILLVEDHADTMQVLTKLLRQWGHVTSTADCVRSALVHVDKNPVDLLISDLGLPDGSGLEIMREARKHYPGLRGIALSGYGTEDDVRQSSGAGFEKHLVKPVSAEDLQSAISQFASQMGKAL